MMSKRFFISQPRRGVLDRFGDLLVSGAAAQVAGGRLADLVAAGIGIAVEQRLGGHDHARRAVAALRAAEVGERRLQWVEVRSARESLDRLDPAPLAVEGERQAGPRG